MRKIVDFVQGFLTCCDFYTEADARRIYVAESMTETAREITGLAGDSDWQEQSAGSLLGHDFQIFQGILSSTGLSIFTSRAATIANCHWQGRQLHKALEFT
ncbi:hypothetical protein ALC62_05244 [Cyphomyrmex costatus]|uniref:Uncharacterized protein n=1 Tax=Cyphomyrmex costatus TaxID=456900 RepID=A0A151IJZ1_9HYME|nr:hypothetical protein ALC62_05244 [Cyphomyrmex costatus]